jgi:hypothetical protein
MNRTYPGLVESRRPHSPPPALRFFWKIVIFKVTYIFLNSMFEVFTCRIERGLGVHLAPEFPRTRSIPRFTLTM